MNHRGMDVTEWLLDSDPSIRWQVLRDLTDASPDAVAAERSRIATEGWGAQLLALQDDRGYWGGHEYGRDRDRRSVQWTLQALRRFGIDPAQPETRAAIDRVRDGVTWSEFDDRPYFHGEVEPCVNGGVLAAAAYFGELGDGSDRIIGMLLDEQLDDGGWNCDAPESDRTSVDTTICVIEGLAEYERVIGESDPAITDARVRAEEYLLERRLFRRKSTGELIKERYVDFAFPPVLVLRRAARPRLLPRRRRRTRSPPRRRDRARARAARRRRSLAGWNPAPGRGVLRARRVARRTESVEHAAGAAGARVVRLVPRGSLTRRAPTGAGVVGSGTDAVANGRR